MAGMGGGLYSSAENFGRECWLARENGFRAQPIKWVRVDHGEK